MTTGASTQERQARLAACVERARRGEPHALDEAVQELTPLLWHVARSQGLSAEDATDVVQTTWLELLRRLHELRSPEALTAWLVTATRREAWHVHSRTRRHTGEGTDVLDTLADPAPGPGERALTGDRHRTLAKHFRLLPERCKRLLRVVAHVDRPDYDEVSEALDMPRGSIGPTRGRCLAKLREMLLADPAWTSS